MEALMIAATRNTPSVSFDPRSNTFSLVGNSIPENAGTFYGPVLSWLQKELPGLPDGATFVFCLPYFNSSSLKALYLLLIELKKSIDSGKQLNAIWHVEENDDFMAEAAETFSEMTEITFTLKEGIIQPPANA